MSVNYSVDKSITSTVDRHAERVTRLADVAVTDSQAASSVRQSLKLLEEKDKGKFQELMQNPAVAEIYEERNPQKNQSLQGNPSPRPTQGKQPCTEHDRQESEGSEESISSEPQTHLVLTVGTNALPVWVAWHNLKEKLLQPVSVQFVYTLDTSDAKGSQAQKNLLESYCKTGGTSVLMAIPVDANKPDRDQICNGIINARPNNCTGDIHVHYTGGTQAMGVATVLAAEKATAALRAEGLEVQDMDASYLDPGRSTIKSPNIVSWRTDPIRDTRKSVCVPADADINKVADLNNFEVAAFKSDHPPKCCPDPSKPSEEKLCAGQKVLELRWDDETNFEKFRDSWNGIFRSRNSEGKWVFQCPSSRVSCKVPQKIFSEIQRAYPNCNWQPCTYQLSYDPTNADQCQMDDLKEMHSFLDGIWVEYAAYAAFKQVLEKIHQNVQRGNSEGYSRDNYQLFHNVYVGPKEDIPRPPGTPRTVKHFELDVVAMLGYQVIVVSCSATPNQAQLKLKAMEAYHRAKQLGGDEARAVMLGVSTNHSTATKIRKELEDDTGIKQPLQVWERCNMEDLCEKFKKLLSDLGWG